MQLNDEESIFFEDIDIVIEGYCTCDLYFPTTKEVNIQKNKAHYVQIFYLTSQYGLFQLLVSDELNICDLEKVHGFETPDLILDYKLAENYKNVIYRYYTFNKISNKNRNILAFQYPIDDEFEVFMYDFRDCLISIDESNYTDVNVYFKKRSTIPEVNNYDFEKYVLSLKMDSLPIGTLDEKIQILEGENSKPINSLETNGGYLRDLR